MEVFDMREFDGHELVLFGHDAPSGLKAIIALHSTVLGPAAGGCRMWPYATTTEAVADVLRLSRGMSYKNALAGLPFGGGKAVIIADARSAKTPELFAAFGRMVDSLRGRYVTAEDVGTTTADMAHVARVTKYVSGLGRSSGGAGGDPAPKTALGVLLGIQAAVRFRLGRTDLAGLTVAVQGAGGVGYHLSGMLAAAGARLKVADVLPRALERVCDEFKATPVDPERLLEEEADVLAPCALGAILTPRSIARLRVPVVGEIWIKYQVAQFARVLGTLLTGGIPLLQALETASESLGTSLLRKTLDQARKMVKEGQALSSALEQTGIFPSLSIDMIEVGESTGALPAMLTSVAEFYEDDVNTRMTATLSLIEPAIMIFMGAFVTFVLVALYLPIFSLADSLR